MQEKHPTGEAADRLIEDDAERVSRALAHYESEVRSQRISLGRRVSGGAALLVLAVAALTACGGGDSSAPTASCVSSAQAAKLHQGMTRPEVQKLFGSPGEAYASGKGWENRGWDSCEDKSHELGVLFVQKGDQWAVKCESGCTL